MVDDTARNPDDIRALVDVLGIDLARLDRRTRAAIEALVEEVAAMRAEADGLRAALAEAESLADNDALCPVFNRRAFEREVRREIALAGRYDTPLCLIFIDLDNFKLVNDVYGHTTGDSVLREVAAILRRQTRQTDIVGRLGGDEFGVVLAHADMADAQRKAAQLAAAIDALEVRSPVPDERPAIQVGGSCGIVAWRPGQGAEALIAAADQAMFLEKARRRRAAQARGAGRSLVS